MPLLVVRQPDHAYAEVVAVVCSQAFKTPELFNFVLQVHLQAPPPWGKGFPPGMLQQLGVIAQEHKEHTNVHGRKE